MKKAILYIVAFGMVLPSASSAIGFGGYYTMSFPMEDYTGRDLHDVDFVISFLGFTGKAWYDIAPSIAIEVAGSYNQYPTEPLALLADVPGAFVPNGFVVWDAQLGARFGLPGRFLTPYLSAGVGLYHVSVKEIRYDPVEIHFSKSYPGIYVGAGAIVKLFGPVSFDVSPTYSYVLGTGGDDDKLKRLSAFDLNFGIAVDL